MPTISSSAGEGNTQKKPRSSGDENGSNVEKISALLLVARVTNLSIAIPQNSAGA